MDKAKSEMVDNFFEQAEPFTARLFEYLSDVYFFIKDREGRFMKVNGNFLKLFGYKKEEEVVGLTDFDMVSRELAIKYENDDKNDFNENPENRFEATNRNPFYGYLYGNDHRSQIL